MKKKAIITAAVFILLISPIVISVKETEQIEENSIPGGISGRIFGRIRDAEYQDNSPSSSELKFKAINVLFIGKGWGAAGGKPCFRFWWRHNVEINGEFQGTITNNFINGKLATSSNLPWLTN